MKFLTTDCQGAASQREEFWRTDATMKKSGDRHAPLKNSGDNLVN